jgi:aromatic-L-amino-acid decarboxylase
VSELELKGDELRRMIDEAARRIVEYIDRLPDAKSDLRDPAEFARSLREAMPESGEPYEKILDHLFDVVIPRSFLTAGPGYLAYIPGGGLPAAAIADLIADATNRYVGVFAAGPGLAQLESNVVGWFCGIVGYGEGSGGILTTGGSLSNFSAIVAARRDRLPDDFLKGTLYVSDQTHHSIQKAAILAGFPEANVREIPTDAAFRIRVDALERRVAEDRAAGWEPFLVVGNAGTTNTGAIDDLGAIADVAERERLWYHVDAAYGGFFALTERGRRRLAGMERSDSAALDPHKALFLPYGNGALLVRDRETLRRAHALSAEYLPEMQHDPTLPDFNLLSPELSRDWRGLRVWLPFKLHGVAPFRRNLDEKLDLAEWAAAELEKIPDVEILARPQLSTLAFRVAPKTLGDAETNALNERIMSRVNEKGRVHLTGTKLRGRFAIRISVLSFRTHLDRMQEGLEDLRAAIEDTR